MPDWEVFAIKYAERPGTRGDSFLFDEAHDTPYPMDYFMWLLRRGSETILVDTGYDEAEAERRDRQIIVNPVAALAPLGITPDDITKLIVTHLHYDHAGGLHLFPNATLHMQEAEMVYATGPCMCQHILRFPYTADHVCEAIHRLYSGKVTFHEGDAEIAEGVTVHKIGGHTRGLQCVRVRTAAGWLVLASDAAHFYENMNHKNPFPMVVDVEDMLVGFDRMKLLASRRELIVPGHDPLVRTRFPKGPDDHITRLDQGPI